MIKGYIEHPDLGKVIVTVNPRARRFTARWKGTMLHLTSPLVSSEAAITKALDNMADRLIASRPAPFDFAPGSVMRFDGFSLEVSATDRPRTISSQLVRRTDGTHAIMLGIGSGVDVSDHACQKVISRQLRRAAEIIASDIMLPLALDISGRLGVRPSGWEIGRGVNRLGSCGSDRRISLSCMCIFLPPRLREYIICHELAHLTHFDHSAAFHALCSAYCGGDGNERRAELKRFVWPVPRC